MGPITLPIMIAYLHGTILDITDSYTIVITGGIGYKVYCSTPTLNALPHKGEVSLWIEHVVREDKVQLFGFASKQEQAWFLKLSTVQGVGSRVALAILSALPPDALSNAIALQNKAAIQRADGVGAKLAARLITELKDTASLTITTATTAPMTAPSTLGDAVLALQALGYDSVTATTALKQVKGTTTADLVTGALKLLGKAS
jgi:holliday junction DNA helicase RuvA